MANLTDRRRRWLQKLPALDEVLRGSLVERLVRCGKQTCRCARGDRHEAVYLSVTHRGGRTEQISVPRDLVGRVRHGIAIYRKWWEILEQISAINRDLLRAQRARRLGGGGEDGAGKGAPRIRRARRRRAQ